MSTMAATIRTVWISVPSTAGLQERGPGAGFPNPEAVRMPAKGQLQHAPAEPARQKLGQRREDVQ